MKKLVFAPVAALVFAGLAMSSASAADQTVREGDFISGLSDTRAAGHVDFLRDGLHVYTDDDTSHAKAAEYFSVTGPLPTSASLIWFGTTPQPGQQIVFDADGIDNNGNDYNILVGEPVYGDNWWLTNGSSAEAKAADPSGANDGGNGSAYFGTLSEWSTALPQARIYAGGFSLGSGVKGDGVISSITYGADTYSFTNDAAAPVVVTKNVTGTYDQSFPAPRRIRIDFNANDLGTNEAQGAKLRWTVKVDGALAFRTAQSAGDNDVWAQSFARATGKHTVEVFKNGALVRTFKVATK